MWCRGAAVALIHVYLSPSEYAGVSKKSAALLFFLFCFFLFLFFEGDPADEEHTTLRVCVSAYMQVCGRLHASNVNSHGRVSSEWAACT